MSMGQARRLPLLPLLLLLLCARPAPGQGGDNQDHHRSAAEPCSLNGYLRQGRCVCDPGWRGPECDALATAPSRVLWPQLADGDPRLMDSPALSWGGSLLFEEATGLWYCAVAFA